MAAPVTPTDDGTLNQDAVPFPNPRPPLHLRNSIPASSNSQSGAVQDDRVPSRAWPSSASGYGRLVLQFMAERAMLLAQWLDTVPGRGVIKCSLAYTIASLATFVGPVSDFLGKPDGKHVVATITVYFHAARSTGSMIEAILIAIVAVAYAELVSIVSMATSVLVGSSLGLVTLSHILVVTVFIGAAFGAMGWVKQRLNNPLVNVASTLASLAIIGVVTKENAVVSNVFSNHKIVQVSKMLVMGITCTAAVSLLLWRVSARQLLRVSLIKASVLLGDMLSDATSSFLSSNAQTASSPDFLQDSHSYSQAHTLLLKNLREAKFEHYLLGRHKLYKVEKATVCAIETLAQSIGALRSAAKAQFELLHSAGEEDTGNSIRIYSPGSKLGRNMYQYFPQTSQGSQSAAMSTAVDTETHVDLFNTFETLIRLPMQNLSGILCRILTEPPFDGPPAYGVRVNELFRDQLTDSIELFNDARIDALQQLYDIIRTKKHSADPDRLALEETAAACGHFCFSLQSFAEEMKKYMDVLEDLQQVNDHPRRSWQWLLWCRRDPSDSEACTQPFESSEAEGLIKPGKEPIGRHGITETLRKRRNTYTWKSASDSTGFLAHISLCTLQVLRSLARDDILFGIKVGIGAALWAILAFLEATRDWYNHYRGEWGLLSFMIVCSMTVGASNTTGWARFIGTFMGAALSLLNWTVSQGNAVALVFLGWLVSVFNFYLIVARGKAPLGRMTILAYNVSTLYAYSLSQKVEDNDDDEGGVHPLIWEIVRHRVVSVTAGIIWGLMVCRLIFPISARAEFKEGVSVLFLQMGLIWKRGPLAILLRSDCTKSYLKSGEQVALQQYSERLEVLRHSAASEFELRGPFPFQTNGHILRSTNKILDSFYSMSLVAQRKGNLTAGEKALLEFTAPERAVLCDRICHIFQVLASSVMLEYPLTDAVPSVTNTRDQLLRKVFQFRDLHFAESEIRVETSRQDSIDSVLRSEGNPVSKLNVEERDFALLYAYALVTGQVANELTVIEKEIDSLFSGTA